MMPHDPHAMTPELALRLVREAESMNRDGIARLQRERLRTLLAYARTHSPLLAEKYRDLPAQPELSEIPPLLRSEAASRFDDWVCDREISSRGVKAFLATPDNLTRDYLGRYRVLTTSGSTDVPLIMVRDDRHNLVNGALMQSRLWGGSKLGKLERLRQPWLRACAVTTGGGYHSSYLSFLRMQQAYEKKGLGDRIAFFSIDTPLPRMVEGLNALQPEIIGAYPSTLQILARARQAGQLVVSPLALFSSAEYLSPEVMEMLETTFQCPVMDNYCSTEAGEVSMLCSANRMHVNSDWIIVEPVDADNRPAREGFSDGVLITNLANLVQPVIRYRISDRAILRHEACPCGSPFPSLEIEGRKEDILEFAGEEGPFLVAPPVLMTSAMHVTGCLTGQFIQRSPTDLEVRCESLDNADKSAVTAELLTRVRGIFAKNHASNVRVYGSDEPVIRGKSGKLRALLKDFS